MYKKSYYNLVVDADDSQMEFIFYNSVDGAFIVVPKEVFNLYNKFDFIKEEDFLSFDNEEKEVFDLLISNGYYVDYQKDEILNLKTLYWEKKYVQNTLDLTIMSTLDCNFKCVYCFERRKKVALSDNLIDKIVKYVESVIARYEKIHIDWYGGEPLMEFEKIKKLSKRLIDVATRNNVQYTASMTTNGYLLTSKIHSDLENIKIKSFQITVDGIAKVHDSLRPLSNGNGTFEVIINNIKYYLEKNFHVFLRINVTKYSINQVTELIDFLEQENMKKNLTILVKPVVSSEVNQVDDLIIGNMDFAKKIVDIYKYGLNKEFQFGFEGEILYPYFKFCVVDSASQLIIAPDATIYKCADEMTADEICGYLNEDGEIEYVNNVYSKWICKDPFVSEKCLRCKLLPLCMGGCQMKNIKNNKGNSCTEIVHNISELLKLHYKYNV